MTYFRAAVAAALATAVLAVSTTRALAVVPLIPPSGSWSSITVDICGRVFLGGIPLAPANPDAAPDFSTLSADASDREIQIATYCLKRESVEQGARTQTAVAAIIRAMIESDLLSASSERLQEVLDMLEREAPEPSLHASQ